MPPDRDEIQALAADLQSLRVLIAQLTGRIYRLEQAAKLDSGPVEAPVTQHSSVQAAMPGISVPTEPLFPIPPPVSAEKIQETSRPVNTSPSTRVILRGAADEGLESRIGSQWLNRIGIIAMLVGVSYFLKYAFENNWIGPGMRVLIGIAGGIGVLLWSEGFRRRGYEMFSYSLKAVGIGVLYLSLWAAFQLYELVSASMAFAAMVAVTAATALVAIRQNAMVLAALALVGGFLTPVLVATHQNREYALFSYVALLDLGVLALIAFRPWRVLALGSFFGTFLLYVGWYGSYYTRPQLDTTLMFATLFFVIFSLVPVASARRESIATSDGQISQALVLLPLLNSAIYFIEVYVMLEPVSRSKTAGVAVGIAAYYLLLSWASGAELAEQERRLMRMLHAGLAVGFVTIAIPLKLDGHWITIGWLVECAALLWIARRINYGFLNRLAAVALVFGLFRLLFLDVFHTSRLLFNERMFTYLIAIAVLAAIVRAGSTGGERDQQAARWAAVGINVLALAALSYEISDTFNRARVGALPEELRTLNIARAFSYSALYMGYGAVLMFIGFWRRAQRLRWQALALIAIAVVKVFVYDTSQLQRIYRILSFIMLGVLLLGISFAYQRNWLKLTLKSPANSNDETDAALQPASEPPPS
jgi:uncharacterized membrane protein